MKTLMIVVTYQGKPDSATDHEVQTSMERAGYKVFEEGYDPKGEERELCFVRDGDD